MGSYWVYVLASKRRVLYVGVTNDIARRLLDYRSGLTKGFVTKYNVDRLVHIEEFADPMAAIEREKQLKRWVRRKKVALIDESNPEWKDLSDLLPPSS
jgi:putative endonuclease